MNKTLEESIVELNEAFKQLLISMVINTKLDKLLDWLAKKLK